MAEKISAPRIEWIDFAKGLAIILVVLGHALSSKNDLHKFIFVFHMPFFFIMAGFLLNLSKWSGSKNFMPFAKKLFWRLLVPYYVAEILWYPIWFVACHEQGLLNYLWTWCEIEPAEAFSVIFISDGASRDLILGQLWFLPVLFFAEIIFVNNFNFLNRFGAEILTLTIVLYAYVGFNVKNFSFMPLGIDIAFTAQIFLLAGVLIRRLNVVDRMNLKICFVLIAITFGAFYLNSFIDMHSRRYGNALLFYAGGLAGTLLVMKFSALATGSKIFSPITLCGR